MRNGRALQIQNGFLKTCTTKCHVLIMIYYHIYTYRQGLQMFLPLAARMNLAILSFSNLENIKIRKAKHLTDILV